jgi:hypothetical protein
MVKSRRIKWAEHAARIWEKMNVYRILMGEPKGNRPTRGSIYRLVDNMNLDHREIE